MSDERPEITAPERAATTPPRPSLRAGAWWLVFAGILVALDGPAGGAVAVVVAAVLLAGLPRAALAVGGLVALAGVPVAILLRGLPADDEVSPDFVVGSLWPHHLTFAGLVLLGTYVVLDVAAHRRAEVADHGAALASEATPGPLARPLALGLLAVVTVGAIAASLAVLAT